MTLTAAAIAKKDRPLITILFAGLTAGVLDISAAFLSAYIINNATPDRVLRFVASGVFGKEALSGGTAIALWGLLFHFMIATIFAAFFYLIYPMLKVNSKNVIFIGLVYGIFVWMVMNLIVVKLSNVPPQPFKLVGALRGAIILMLCIGLPIALITHRFRKKESN